MEVSGHIALALDKPLENTLIDNKGSKIELKDYQYFTAKVFLGLKTFRQILLFWETGAGKTIECIFILKHLNLIYPKWHIFIFIKASLHQDPWQNNIDKYNVTENKITIIHYDDPNSYLIFQKKIKEIDLKSVRLLFLIDESHNFISRALEIPNKKRYATRLYNLIQKLLINTENRIILVTATPIINTIKEFNLMCGLLRNNLGINNNMYFNNKLLPKSDVIRILSGMCSYKSFNEENTLEDTLRSEYFPQKNIKYIYTTMSDYQSEIYNKATKLEYKLGTQGFRILRRLTSTFVYQGLKAKSDEYESYEDYENTIKERTKSFLNEYSEFRFSKKFIDAFKLKNEYLFSDVNELITFKTLQSYSCKYIECCRTILNSEGKCLIYEPFVSFEGTMSLKVYLKCFGIKSIEYNQNSKDRTKNVLKFNDQENINGTLIKVCIFSNAGSEGISFFGINDLIILDIPWSDSSLRQIIGRGIRLYSHSKMPIDRQYININIIIAKTLNEISIDEEMLELLINKYKKLSELYDVLKKTSLEYIYKNYPTSVVQDEYIFNKLLNEQLKVINQVDVLKNKELREIYYFDDVILVGYLDNEYNIYKDQIKIGETSEFNFDIIDDKIVYYITTKKVP